MSVRLRGGGVCDGRAVQTDSEFGELHGTEAEGERVGDGAAEVEHFLGVREPPRRDRRAGVRDKILNDARTHEAEVEGEIGEVLCRQRARGEDGQLDRVYGAQGDSRGVKLGQIRAGSLERGPAAPGQERVHEVHELELGGEEGGAGGGVQRRVVHQRREEVVAGRSGVRFERFGYDLLLCALSPRQLKPADPLHDLRLAAQPLDESAAQTQHRLLERVVVEVGHEAALLGGGASQWEDGERALALVPPEVLAARQNVDRVELLGQNAQAGVVLQLLGETEDEQALD